MRFNTKYWPRLGALLIATGAVVAGNIGWSDDWNRFRGTAGAGVDRDATIVTEWSESQNVKWKTPLPGFGSSCPIVVGDQVIVTCYSGYGIDKTAPGEIQDLKRHLLSIDRVSGKINWQKEVPSAVPEDKYEGFITEHGYASSTPVSDGQRVFAFFGKSGLLAFDLKGELLWQKSLGEYSDPAKWGDGASPVLYEDLVIVNAGIVGHAIVALRAADGTEVWRIENEGFTNGWATPIVVQVDGREEMVFNLPQEILAINPRTGEKYWNFRLKVENNERGQPPTICASLAESQGVVFRLGGRTGGALAVRCGGSGDVTETHKVWEAPLRGGIGTPLAADGRLYLVTSGLLTCVDTATGKELYKERLPKLGAAPSGGERSGPAGDYSSPILLGDKLVVMARNGTTNVVLAGDQFQVLSTNSLGADPGPFNSTPAYAAGHLFIRSNEALYCLGQ